MNTNRTTFSIQELRMADHSKAHPNDEWLEQYAMGRLREPELGSVEEHLLLCENCQNRLDETTEFITVFREAARLEEPMAPATESVWRRILRLDWMPLPAPALAGAFAVLAAVLVWQEGARPNPGDPAEKQWSTVELATFRGEAQQPRGVALEGFGLDLRLDAGGLETGPATAQIVTGEGRVVDEVPVTVTGGRAVFRYGDGLAAGRYWVRLRQGGEMVREFALTVDRR
jgi:hypothetical protein